MQSSEARQGGLEKKSDLISVASPVPNRRSQRKTIPSCLQRHIALTDWICSGDPNNGK
jgi:hypothetical protein